MKHLLLFFIITLSFHLYSQKNPEKVENETDDTTKLIVEKYVFNKFGTIDTSAIDTFQIYIELLDNYEKDYLPVINLGQIGTPSLNIIFSKRKEFKDFMFLNPYIEYIFIPKDLSFYKTNNPYTDIKYIGASKSKEQQRMDFIHTQSVGTHKFGIEFKMTTARNLASESKQNSTINNLNFWYHKQIKNYNIYAAIYSSNIKRPENGGIIDTPQYDPETSLYQIQNANNSIINRGFIFRHYYSFNEKYLIQHCLNYNLSARTFSESKLNSEVFGQPLIAQQETFDSVSFKSFDNTISFMKKHSFGNMNLSFTNKLRNIYYFKGYIYDISGEFHTDNFLSLSISDLKLKFLHSYIKSDYHLTDRQKGDFDFLSGQNIYLNKNNSTYINFLEKFERYTPDFFYEHYNGNYESWKKSFSKSIKIFFETNINFEKFNFHIGGNYSILNNFIYFDSVAQPRQVQANIYLTTVWAKKIFRFKPFVFDINLIWQKNNHNEVLNVPEFIAAGSFYLDFDVFKGAAHIHIGFSANYTSEFYMYSYRPTTGVFYVKNERITGNYPIANLFFTARIKRATIIVRFDHTNAMLLQPYYSTVENYHLNDYYLRFGVRWWFKN